MRSQLCRVLGRAGLSRGAGSSRVQTMESIRTWIDWPGHICVAALNEGAAYCADGFAIQFERGGVWVAC
jgi:hypothetical protein